MNELELRNWRTAMETVREKCGEEVYETVLREGPMVGMLECFIDTIEDIVEAMCDVKTPAEQALAEAACALAQFRNVLRKEKDIM